MEITLAEVLLSIFMSSIETQDSAARSWNGEFLCSVLLYY